MMLSILHVGVALLAYTGYVASENGAWVKMRIKDADWQYNCGHVRRAGAVCVSAQYGHYDQYRVQFNAQQDVVFSGDQRRK